MSVVRASLVLSLLGLVLGAASGCAQGDPIENTGGGGAGESGGGATTSDTGCEGVDLDTDPANCGVCGRTCVPPHAEASCVAGECAIAECELGFADCDGTAETGCELQVDCDEGAACDTACGSTGGLVCADACTPTCAVPAETCNGIDDDCDGACDQGPVAGCRVGVHRAYNSTNGHLFTTNLAEAQAWGLEYENFYYLYGAPTADLRPFFRCALGSFTFYTESNDCELTGAPLGTMGFIAPTPAAGAATCGATPLHRLSNPNGWHFYTTSAAERDGAVAGGWTSEGIAGHVWIAP